ncbi:MAG: hypothetical protein A3C50_01315 [Candidatus Staskawiczbacteria bacterium RIFCSPHIGHO2_02_FULL_43_16]|uniref:Uncharacterized protein n=1 Tax=Candidatus Staskawiczbacteria bacterium RIFCSPHIGHO2_01_FULL_41_41 TaxID=1802203 RepID=A0A1G2HUV5_9BACT|nr:MAG: hypothetical protein A2822_04600 [Candidatus Staskawiczbacteria bacterium RIFCSPHIGHO2_01_FULL_41_41]OGZ68847.1 MAG: hypothetical protein A3C50_01315 [Candidatus Staskawiczbacteria bacterium RIFCSPHIGHO2_02_FULL_43_16]OGZ74220.1 MAG: hypothetical protein A3A12_00305 [Candidatus Staskawiczbacteria bacterium RIFCSPLOWO2_01_FULL_43_17b]
MQDDLDPWDPKIDDKFSKLVQDLRRQLREAKESRQIVRVKRQTVCNDSALASIHDHVALEIP